jgi:hypothetical protein
MRQIEAAERLYQQLRDWQRALAALETLHSQLPLLGSLPLVCRQVQNSS